MKLIRRHFVVTHDTKRNRNKLNSFWYETPTDKTSLIFMYFSYKYRLSILAPSSRRTSCRAVGSPPRYRQQTVKQCNMSLRVYRSSTCLQCWMYAFGQRGWPIQKLVRGRGVVAAAPGTILRAGLWPWCRMVLGAVVLVLMLLLT